MSINKNSSKSLILKSIAALFMSAAILFSSGCSGLSQLAELLKNTSSAEDTLAETTDESASDNKDDGGKSPDGVKFYGGPDMPALQQVDFSLFAGSAMSDTISLNYYLRDPSALGLSLPEVTLGKVSKSETDEYYEAYREYQALLETVSYDELSEDEQIMYDVISYDLDEALAYEDYYYYSSSFNSLTGIQSNLPLILCEYVFEDKNDVEDYLLLLEDFNRYYEDLMTFEKERADEGLAPSDENIQKIIDSCESFLEDKDEHFMIASFDERIDLLDNITDKKKEKYKEQNRAALEESVFPAYEMLIDEFEGMLGAGTNDGGLCNFPDGKEYYELLLKSETSTDLTPEEAIEAIENSIDTQLDIVMGVDYNDDFSEAYDSHDFSAGTIEDNIALCEAFIPSDFPAIMEHEYVLKKVPEQLEDFFSPAAYLSCAIDDPTHNVIITNESQLAGYQNVLDTMAHEGYPGHMYEAIYHAENIESFYQRSASFSGYAEGWAQYSAEYVVKHTEEYDPTLVEYIYAEDQVFNLLIPSRIDIGVNYENWSREDVYDYLESLGLDYPDFGDSCYDIAIEIPCYYLMYCIGKIETDRILSDAFDQMDDATPAEIHDAYLSIGPGPLPIVEKYMDSYMEKGKNSD